ncbi:FAD binding domain-containing protein [Alcaligenaceae bacterium LF4-65]|jgi:carbon-monoxide dehydrogenase medium subunit|uniref:FAD binding domain-containing protein n=1 Tax=Zwartia hollandica TaxID=324606 RepID=A0A953NBC2_9BURK|nr:FAD binding domain-containing protein [Zwartia hollandica]MBZ1351955.1 FAD binding domain-containing protein [Zwartia hollandica]
MKAAQFEYVSANSVEQALSVLQAGGERAKPIAGSQSLGPMLNLRLTRPQTVVDLSKLAEMQTVTQHRNTLRVGASITHAQIEDGVYELIRNHPVQMVASRIAYRSVRNRGTLGGSLAHADPAADWVLACAALDARIEVQSASGTKLVSISDFMIAAYTTVLAADDIITAVHFPEVSSRARWGYQKFCRKTGEFAHASCATYIDPASKVARIVVGALDGAPCVLSTLSVSVAAHGLEGFDEAAVQASLQQMLPQQDDITRQMFVQVVLRCVHQAFGVQR